MQLGTGFAAILAGLCGLLACPAAACALVISTNGTLGLSPDGTMLSSEVAGLPGTVTVSSLVGLGGGTVTISAPTRTTGAPAGYNTSSESIEVRYFGIGGLGFVDQSYTSAETSFGISGVLAASVLTIHNRIVNPNGFSSGTYSTQTVVTCS